MVEKAIKNVVFEEELIYLPSIVIDNDKLSDIVQDAIQDNDEVVLKEHTQQSQKEVPIRRSTREIRSTISSDYIVFLQ